MIFGGFVFSNSTVNAAANGWTQQNGTWYYCQNGTTVKNAWKLDSNGWCFLNAVDGSLVQEGWAKDSFGWGYIQNGYWVHFYSQAARENGGSGTTGNVEIAEGGSILNP